MPLSRIAVVIPCYGVKAQILSVLQKMGPECWRIYVVDDQCPERTGDYVKSTASDPRITVVYNTENLGVGGAVIEGYKRAIADGATVIVKVDGDGQMNPELIRQFVQPIIDGQADYTKGNRFFNLEDVEAMPFVRLVGNAVLSFMSKASSGYWTIFDPTNGYTAIGRTALLLLPMEKLSTRYFFETDMLFRLGTFGAVVQDVPMRAVYADEKSNLSVFKALFGFTMGHTRNFFKRILYNYFLRGFSVASVQLIFSIVLLLFGGIYGLIKWMDSAVQGVYASSGTVMLAALPIIVGVQLLISFISFDMQNQPKNPLGSQP